MEKGKNKRIISIDIIRILLVLIIFCFHSCIHMNCTYGIMTKILKNGNLMMSVFFMISGFALFYTNNKKDMHSIDEIKKFYIKRLVGIYPAYIAIVIIYLLFNNTISFAKKIMLLPMDIMMIQSTVDGSFSTLHHDGTWFISCLFVCYLLTPFFVEIIKQLETKKILKLGIIVYLICAYIPFIVKIMGYSSIYSNVIYRSLQFFIGIMIGCIYIRQDTNKDNKYIYVLLFATIIILGIIQKNINSDYRSNDYLIMLVFGTIIYKTSFMQSKGELLQKIVNSSVIKYANEIVYEFFLGQFFCFKITLKTIEYFPVLNNNIIKICFSALVCIIISIGLHELITKPCKKLVNKHIS